MHDSAPSHLQADGAVAVFQDGDDLAVRQSVHRLTVDADDPVPHLQTHRRLLKGHLVLFLYTISTLECVTFVFNAHSASHANISIK